jgi:hypothetical protein
MSNGITIKTAPHAANKFSSDLFSTEVDHFLKNRWRFKHDIQGHKLLGSSVRPEQETVYFQENGFVDTVIYAYNKHHNLVIRPDDVWIAILSQLSFYINDNAETLRSKFVAHEGKKELELFIPNSPLEDIDWDDAGDGMTTLLHKKLVDKDLQTWIIPNFSTTTRVDRTVSAMFNDGVHEKYFDYTFSMLCGIPQVTLEGT